MNAFQIYKQGPGSIDDPGWYIVRTRDAADTDLPPIPYGAPIGPFKTKREAQRAARARMLARSTTDAA